MKVNSPGTIATVLMLVASCTPQQPPQPVRFTSEDDTAIRAVMNAQEKAWDAGDIDGFMTGYADSACFVGRKGLTCGREAITANYRKSYADTTAMGDLTFGITELRPAGADHAWLTGTWRLERTQDTLSGGFSLLWERSGDRWLILRDHSY